VVAGLAASAVARAADPCQAHGPTYFACPKAQGGCRARLGDAWLREKESGLAIKARFLGVLGIEVEDVQLQPIHAAVQVMRQRLVALVHEHDACAITDDEYRARHDAAIGYRDALASEVGRIDALADELQRVSAGAGTTERKIEQLADRERKLKAALSALQASLSSRLAAVEAAARAGQEANAVLRVELTSFRNDVEDRLAGWRSSVDAAVDLRVASLRDEITRQVTETLRLFVLEMTERRGEASHAVINVAGQSAWLDGELRPGVALSWETLRAAGGLLSGFSVFYEASGLLWTRSATFEVFPGQEPGRFEQNASFLAGQVGLKRYVPIGRQVDLYLGAAGGLLTQPRDSWRVGGLGQALAGVTLYFGRARAGVELRYGLHGYRARTVEFDPFGYAKTDHELRFVGVPSASAVFSPFSW
jgi:hypothetical protein